MNTRNKEFKKTGDQLQKIGNTVVRAAFNPNRPTYAKKDWSYVYKFDDGSKVTIPFTGKSADIIIMLNQMDEEWNASDERYQQVTDQVHSYDDLADAADGIKEEGVTISTRRMMAVATPGPDIHEQSFPEPEPEPSEEERKVKEAIKACPERWQNYFHDRYGGVVANQEEYRQREMAETGETKSLAAISKMDTKLKQTVCDALGEPMPAKKRGRKG